MLRSSFAAVLVLAMSACKPDLPHTEPTSTVNVVFDPTTSQIPLPNDLAFLVPANSACPDSPPDGPPACAQAELLNSFGGEFPNDQEVAVTIDFVKNDYDADGKVITSAPDLDLSTFTPSTFFVTQTTAAGTGEVAIEPLTDADYVVAADGSHGTLTIHNQNRLPWTQGSYAVFVRGGDQGVLTKDKTPVGPSQVFDLIAQGLDMEDPKNLGLLKAQFGTTAAALAQGKQLNGVIALYKAGPYPIADAKFPHHELAILTTFKIGPLQTNVSIDPQRGLAPLPIDLLRDSTGHLSELAACTFASSKLSADGKSCATAQATAVAAGFAALDGFSTTGAILGPTSDLILAKSVTATSAQLYDLSDPAHPVQVPPTNLVIEPCEFTQGCGLDTALSPVIALQPAGASAGNPASVFLSKPLKDNTDYAVVFTHDIVDKAGKPLASGTVANILKFTNPVSINGKSALAGIDDGTTAQLEKMRLQLAPVVKNVGADKIAIAYTFHTQTILSQATQLAALPYSTPAATALPSALVNVATAAQAQTRYGIPSSVPVDAINEVLEVDITTFNALNPATGAFLPDPTQAAAETIHVLITTPKTSPKFCTGTTGPKCAPLMVFRHGLSRGRQDSLLIANTFAAAGMVTVAIDAAKHGDRSFCTSGAAAPGSGCISGACTTPLPAGAQGDVAPPGTCTNGFIKLGLDGNPNANGIAAASGNYLISANFFRTRDTMRQDLIDESQLIRAIAVDPTSPAAAMHSVLGHMAPQGIIIDPQTIYFTGQSLGSIQGTMDVAANPRISKAVFNVGGGSLVDVFTNSPAFAGPVQALLDSLHISKTANPAGYLQFLTVAKTVLDPADPVNFAGHLLSNTLPNLLPPLGGNTNGSVPQAAKKILTQIAYCDNTVPNPFNVLHSSNIGVGPLPAADAFFAGGVKGTFQLFVNTGFVPANFKNPCSTTATPTPGTVSHGFLLDGKIPTLTGLAQASAAAFVSAPDDNTAKQTSLETP